MYRLLLVLCFFFAHPIFAQSLTEIVEKHQPNILKGSVKTAAPIIADIQAVGTEAATEFLTNWQDKALWFIKETGQIVSVVTDDKKTYQLIDIETGTLVTELAKKDIKQIKPNSGLRKMLGSALVTGKLLSPQKEIRLAGVDALIRDPKASHLDPLRVALEAEADIELKGIMDRAERQLTIQFDDLEVARVAAIESFSNDLSVEARGTLNPLLSNKIMLADLVPEDANIKGPITPGSEALTYEDAFDLLVAAEKATPVPTNAEIASILEANIENDTIAGFALADMSDADTRIKAYLALADAGKALAFDPNATIADLVADHEFIAVYVETSKAVTDAASNALDQINAKVGFSRFIDLALDGVSLASIYFLAAIGLAITFGVMRVINMAHGEFIMMGAYTGFVVQQIIPNYTVSIILAVPLAFAVTFAAGVAMERLVIRHLYHRPLETLLATFGISIALQQIAKNIFGTQARPLTAPGWLDGSLVINEVIQISWIRIAIFVLSLLFLLLLLFILNKTRLGLETRAVTQNPRMAASMGINPDRINMLTFGLGSGIAGIAGVAIGLYAKVTSELGADYIVQSFMTVVVGGVGNIWGTLAGATMIGFLQKGIEWFNPSNTLAAQTYMIIFIIIFIQFRPRGIIALKGRAAGD
ncbi:MAG: urea ABC transporter permease subunit UrtB [Pseudomonadota bacterium]